MARIPVLSRETPGADDAWAELSGSRDWTKGEGAKTEEGAESVFLTFEKKEGAPLRRAPSCLENLLPEP